MAGAFQSDFVQSDAFQTEAPAQTVTVDAVLGGASNPAPQVNQSIAPDALGTASNPAPAIAQQAGALPLLGGASLPAPQVNQAVSPGVLSAGTYQQAGLTYNGGIPYDGGASLPTFALTFSVRPDALGGASLPQPTINQTVALAVLGGATLPEPSITSAAAGLSVLPDALGGASTPAPTVNLGIGSPGALGGATVPAPTVNVGGVIVSPPMLSAGTYEQGLTYNGGVPYDGGASLPVLSVAVGGLSVRPELLGGADVPSPRVDATPVIPPDAAVVTGRGGRLRQTRVVAVAQGIRPARLGGALLNGLTITVHDNEDWVIDDDLLVLV